MNALLLQHVALPTPSPPRTATTLPAPIIIITRNPKPLRAQGRGFGSGAGAGAAISDAKKGEIKIKRQDDDDEEEEEDDDEIPQVVFDRMLRRIAVAVGAPMAAGWGRCARWGAEAGGRVAAPAWVPFVAALLAFGTSAFGIAYGTLSASWDPDREGSPLGWEEARTNWTQLWNDHDHDAQNRRRS
uniref:Protein PAM68, chloroplastic n=1 Tax=Ananas comosus var. bracteatus TaxID=296719 RepID=A0A6V7PX75_ANACO|nr:unnamed protein product [Ananas comosus var. bracteatus]